VLYTPVRRLRRWFTGRRFLWLLGIAVCVSILWLAGSHLGPGLRAANGQGTVGLWTAQEQDSGQWYGEFVSSAGTVTLPHVYYAGSLPAVQAGTVVPALDGGAGDEVYPLAGSHKWIHDVIGVVVAGVALIALLARVFFAARRRRRAGRADWFNFEQLCNAYAYHSSCFVSRWGGSSPPRTRGLFSRELTAVIRSRSVYL
jgi:hypothetical protein